MMTNPYNRKILNKRFFCIKITIFDIRPTFSLNKFKINAQKEISLELKQKENDVLEIFNVPSNICS